MFFAHSIQTINLHNGAKFRAVMANLCALFDGTRAVTPIQLHNACMGCVGVCVGGVVCEYTGAGCMWGVACAYEGQGMCAGTAHALHFGGSGMCMLWALGPGKVCHHCLRGSLHIVR